MAEITQHDARLEIASESPSNKFHLRLHIGGGNELSLYVMDVEQWWALRNAMPKADGYYFADAARVLTRDHAQADARAAAFYEEHEKARMAEAAA